MRGRGRVRISPYAELMLCLPADWPLTRLTGLDDDPAGWPVRVLKQVARLPHEYGTWIGEWHSVPNGDSAQPYARCHYRPGSVSGVSIDSASGRSSAERSGFHHHHGLYGLPDLCAALVL
ncbi:suppressor of fused domain protein [Micromonospora purpureochromogenes]|uniref:suppressor of fused domain protein n=1 Tax=Micromonospora purpureochromogenes TaxID=47872 RepID=UPI0033C5CF4E